MSSPAEELVMATPRRRGRPRVHQRKLQVGVSLPPAYVERIYAHANKRDVAVSEVLRRIVVMHLDGIKKTD